MTAKNTTESAITKAALTRKTAYQGDVVAEGKQAAISNFGHLVTGQMSDEEFTELVDYAVKASTNLARKSARDFGIAYLATIELLTATL